MSSPPHTLGSPAWPQKGPSLQARCWTLDEQWMVHLLLSELLLRVFFLKNWTFLLAALQCHVQQLHCVDMSGSFISLLKGCFWAADLWQVAPLKGHRQPALISPTVSQPLFFLSAALIQPSLSFILIVFIVQPVQIFHISFISEKETV